MELHITLREIWWGECFREIRASKQISRNCGWHGLLWRSFSKHSRAQNFCIAEKEYIGLYADGTRPRDNVCVLLGGIALVVLWKSNARDHHFRLAGECYIHGIMKGEAFESTDFNGVDLFLW
jgi:hypothetical protein